MAHDDAGALVAEFLSKSVRSHEGDSDEHRVQIDLASKFDKFGNRLIWANRYDRLRFNLRNIKKR